VTSSRPASTTGFDAAWQVASAVPGWCTREQAEALWQAASRLGPGASVLEIGSHKGRSTLVLSLAVQEKSGRVHAVDPFVEGRLFGGQPTRRAFEENVKGAGQDDVVTLHPEYSGRLRRQWDQPIDLLYVDGKHDYWTARDDFRWGEHLPEGGEMLVHDAYSSVGVTLAVLVSVLCGADWVYVERTGSLALFRRARPRPADRLRVLAEMPWFVRNVGVKVLLRLRLRPLTRLLGHDSPVDPY
jgi:predicted O-methyltransferase YrrM